MKKCSKCTETKKLEYFYKQKFGKLGRRADCKECSQKRDFQKYQLNKELIKEQKLIYRESNKEKLNEQKRQYYKENRERILKRQAKYNKYKHIKDPLFNLSCKIRGLIRKSIQRQGFSKSSKTAEILGCSFEELQAHLRATFEANYGLPFNWVDSSLLHIDHKIPLATAKTEEDLIKLNHFSNLQYLLAEDNLEKGDSLDWKL